MSFEASSMGSAGRFRCDRIHEGAALAAVSSVEPTRFLAGQGC